MGPRQQKVVPYPLLEEVSGFDERKDEVESGDTEGTGAMRTSELLRDYNINESGESLTSRAEISVQAHGRLRNNPAASVQEILKSLKYLQLPPLQKQSSPEENISESYSDSGYHDLDSPYKVTEERNARSGGVTAQEGEKRRETSEEHQDAIRATSESSFKNWSKVRDVRGSFDCIQAIFAYARAYLSLRPWQSLTAPALC